MKKPIYNSLSVIRNESLARKFAERSHRKILIEDFIHDFLCEFISEETKRAYIKDLNYFFSFLRSGDVVITHPNQIEPFHFQEYRDEMIAQGYSAATINRRMVAVRSFMKWSLALGLISFNPLDAVKLPKVKTEQETVAFDDLEAIRMIAAPSLLTHKGRMNRLAMVLLFNLGLRRSELVNIRIRDLFEDRGHQLITIHGKGDKKRILPLSEYVQNEIARYLNSFPPSWRWLPEDYLLQKSDRAHGKVPINGSTVYRMINSYARKLGINKRVSPHSCRATVISHLLDTKQIPLRDVASFAGHSAVTTTERYDKRRDALNRSAAYSVGLRDDSEGLDGAG